MSNQVYTNNNYINNLETMAYNSNILYFSNYDSNIIYKVDELSNQTIFVTLPFSIKEIIFDNNGFISNGFLYVLCSNNNIYKIDKNSNVFFFKNIPTPNPRSLALDSYNNLYYYSNDYNQYNGKWNIYKLDTYGNINIFMVINQLTGFMSIGIDNYNNFYLCYISRISNLLTVSQYNSNGILIQDSFIIINNFYFDAKMIINNNIYLITNDLSEQKNNIFMYNFNTNLFSQIDSINFLMNNMPLTRCILNGNKLFYTYANETVIYFKKISNIICFKENTQILTLNGYKLIQNLKTGDMVKTLYGGYKPIYKIGYNTINHLCCKERNKEQLYKCSVENFPELFEDLIITGCHCILVDNFKDDEEKRKTIDGNEGKLFVTEGKYRLPAYIDKRTSIYEIPGIYKIYHFALENLDMCMNYGVYANGLLVESTSKRIMDLTKITLL